MTEIARVAPQDVRESVAAGRTLLVCAYDDDQAFRTMRLEGAIPLSALRSLLPSLPKDREIVFYCA